MIQPDDLKRVDRSRRTGLAVQALGLHVPASPENVTTFSGRHDGTAHAETNCSLGCFGRKLAVSVVTAVLAVFSTVLALDEIAASQTTPETTTPAWTVSPVPSGGEMQGMGPPD